METRICLRNQLYPKCQSFVMFATSRAAPFQLYSAVESKKRKKYIKLVVRRIFAFERKNYALLQKFEIKLVTGGCPRLVGTVHGDGIIETAGTPVG